MRIGRFPISNEFGDWDTVHNTWTSCQALAQALARAPSPELARGLYHAAMRIYLDRFLNVPAARLPDERPAAKVSRMAPRTCSSCLDREQQVAPAAAAVDAALANGDHAQVMRTLGHALLREDAEFHGYQTLEAGVRQFTALQPEHPLAARRTLTSITRYIAAHAPTPRAMHQTYQIAVRLLRGDDLTVADESDSIGSASESSAALRPERPGKTLRQRAEDLGFSTLVIPDHFGAQLAPLPAIVSAAAVTTRLRFGTGVLDNDFRHPALLAKEAATVDLLTDGRFELGIGAGGRRATIHRRASRSIRAACAWRG